MFCFGCKKKKTKLLPPYNTIVTYVWRQGEGKKKVRGRDQRHKERLREGEREDKREYI